MSDSIRVFEVEKILKERVKNGKVRILYLNCIPFKNIEIVPIKFSSLLEICV